MLLLQIAALTYLGYVAFFFVLQRRLMYPGAYMMLGWSDLIEPFPGKERLWLNTSVGQVEAWYLPAEADSASNRSPAMILTHGNAELIDHWPTNLSRLGEVGVSLLLVEYPGYGRSEGSPTQSRIMEAVTAGYDWLVSRDDIDEKRIVAMGRSVGGGPASALTRQRSVAALILQSTFSSVGSMAWKAYRLPPFLARDPFDNRAAIAEYVGPVLIFHGRRDDIIPYEQGMALSRANDSVKLITLDCGHNDCPPSWDEFLDEIIAFLTREGILSAPDDGVVFEENSP